MKKIQFFYKPENPVDYNTLKVEVKGNDLSDILNEEDRDIRNDIWGKLVKERGSKVFSRPGGLGCLTDISNNNLIFRPTDFMTYVATSTSYGTETELSQKVYDNMKISAVGGTLKLADDLVFIHRRSMNVTHARGMLDSSVAGLAHIDSNGKIDFQKALLEKLQRELKLKDEEIKKIQLTGLHNSYSPDFSGMVDFVIESSLEKGHLEERIDKDYFSEYNVILQELVPWFVVYHYAVKEDMIGDGAANLLASCDHKTFLSIVGLLKQYGHKIEFGKLENSLFVPN